MKKQTELKWQKQLLFSTIAIVVFLFAANSGAMAQDKWGRGDEWRGQYKVGDKVQFTISGKASDRQTCEVTENEPEAVMKVSCEEFKQWVAGNYIVYGKNYISPANQAATDKEENQADTKTTVGKTKTTTTTKTTPTTKTTTTKTTGGITSNLAGTYWQLLSMTKKGETVTDNESNADVEFCTNGEWGILHYGGARDAGTYKQAGSGLVMKYEDGELYGNYKITRKGDVLELNDGEYLLRLKYSGKAGC
jgi:biotin carboxyl carrier protein